MDCNTVILNVRRNTVSKGFLCKGVASLDDKKLIKRIQQGETDLLDILIEKHYGNIYAFCYRKTGNPTLAYDFTQEVFIKLVQYINTYVDKQKFKSYLFTIAVNVCNDYYRSNKVLFVDLDNMEIVDYEDKFQHIEESEVIKVALEILPDIQKDVVILRYYHDMKIRDIANVVGASLSTTKSRLKQGLGKLKKILGEENNFEK